MYKLLTLFLAFALFIGGTTSAAETPVIWGAKVSPFVRKVLVTMEYKNLPYKNEEILPTVLLVALKQEVPANFSKVSPLGKIPAYQEGEFSVADSSVILAYLEKTHPENSLYPQDPQLFARALWLEKYGDTVFSAMTHVVIIESLIKPEVLKEETDAVAVQKSIEQDLPPILDYLENQLKAPQAGYFLVGDQLTVADIGVSTHLISLKLLNIEIDSKQWPEVAAYLKRILEEASFKKVLK
jgi:glutathione S-transferase